MRGRGSVGGVTVLTVAVALLTSCGGNDPETPEQVAASVLELASAYDPEFCSYITEDGLEMVQGGDGTEEGCRSVTENAVDTPEPATAEVFSSEVNGERATVELQVSSQDGESDMATVQLVSIDGRWLVAGFRSEKANRIAADDEAKDQVRAAETAIETYADDNGGSYSGATPAKLAAIEAALTDADLRVSGSKDAYTVTAISNTGSEFSIKWGADGSVSYFCSSTGSGGCSESGSWVE